MFLNSIVQLGIARTSLCGLPCARIWNIEFKLLWQEQNIFLPAIVELVVARYVSVISPLCQGSQYLRQTS